MSGAIVVGIVIVIAFIWFVLRKGLRGSGSRTHYYDDHRMYDGTEPEADASHDSNGGDDDGGDDWIFPPKKVGYPRGKHYVSMYRSRELVIFLNRLSGRR